MPIFTGFVAVLLPYNCQRWEYNIDMVILANSFPFDQQRYFPITGIFFSRQIIANEIRYVQGTIRILQKCP